MRSKTFFRSGFTISVLLAVSLTCFSQDSLRVMAYNALYYGNGKQGPNQNYHNYLKTIVSYVNPGIVSLEKMASVKTSPEDQYGKAPYGYADSILRYALNAAFPGRYAYCPFSNVSRTNNMSIVFYDQNKLGYLNTVFSYANITNFNLYKLYYKDPNLAQTHDTTFLYIIPNHDLSGDENAGVRAIQIGKVMACMKEHFSRLPNMLNLGDFNVRSSDEPFYTLLTQGSDPDFQFFDPPFFPDHKLKYPANWDHEPSFSAYFTTSTRESASIPNSVGSGGGAKNWYDHIFMSSTIMNGYAHIKYVPNSYRTIGNDGQRFKISINNKNTRVNTSAPAEVIEALYQMSNKYPVMADFVLSPNPTSGSTPNPEKFCKTVNYSASGTVKSTAHNEIVLSFSDDMDQQDINIVCTATDGTEVIKKDKKIKGNELSFKFKVDKGAYHLVVTGHHNIIIDTMVNHD